MSDTIAKRTGPKYLPVSQGLLSSGPPHRYDNQHTRRDGRLESTKDESEDEQSSTRGEGSADHAADAPSEEADHDPPVDGELDQCVHRD